MSYLSAKSGDCRNNAIHTGTGNQKVLVNYADEIAVMMPGAGHHPRTFCCGSAHAVIGEKAL